ncbi:MAG: methionyl-tRNA formyltransferase [Candidatus Aminicenantales bacterium]|jgi:methionyl-tRNA formyltransferase
MRIVFFGSPASALPSLQGLLERGHSVGLVVTQPDKPAGRGRRMTSSAVKAFALERGIPVLEPIRIRTDGTVLGRIQDVGPDVNVVVAYGQIIPAPIIYGPRHHSLNVHFSLLPKYRGAAPVQWAVLTGETETGVTIIELNEKMDEGDILARAATKIGPRETAGDLEARLAAMGASLLLQTLDGLGALTPLPQDHGLASLAPKIRKEDGRIDWSESASAIDRKVRALADRPGTYTLFRARRLQLHRGRTLDAPGGTRKPGEVLAALKDGLRVACGGGSMYLIEELQPEGRTRMPAHEFSLGAKIKPGELLGGD